MKAIAISEGQSQMTEIEIEVFLAVNEPLLQHADKLNKEIFKRRMGGKFAGADGGPRSRVCAHLTLRSGPQQPQRNFCAILAWKGEPKKFENFRIIFLAISANSKQFSFFFKET
jgi:hypothetical protein